MSKAYSWLEMLLKFLYIKRTLSILKFLTGGIRFFRAPHITEQAKSTFMFWVRTSNLEVKANERAKTYGIEWIEKSRYAATGDIRSWTTSNYKWISLQHKRVDRFYLLVLLFADRSNVIMEKQNATSARRIVHGIVNFVKFYREEAKTISDTLTYSYTRTQTHVDTNKR